ncbi:uncharacterized protein sh2d7 [Sebastes fasciatus]|uniref:uncharacterized protein sh2d7 n=1 Tax=Sebastes fasciatus TaxID=394691 RepID=UPI003D9DC4FC
MAGVDLNMESSEGGLKELVLRWFTETQAPLILNNGNFPDWFQGFAARKDTEDLLRDKALGCFLIRLSDKAVGYILSYKGQDRCRHFVITQNPDGQFSISGDSQTYRSLKELIEHYKVSPIQPFGEYLTSSCYEVNEGELYDVVNYKARGMPGVSVQALRTLWDHKHDRHSDPGTNQRIQQHNDGPAVQLPALPLKSKSRKLTGAASVDTTSLSQGIPPVPKRGLPLGFTLSDTTSHPSETQTDPNRPETPRGTADPADDPLMSDTDSSNTPDTNYPGDLCPPGFSELTQLVSRSKSLPRLSSSSSMEEEEEEEEYSNQLSHSFSTSYSPSLLKRVTGPTYSLHEPSSSSSEQQAADAEMLKSNPLYQISERAGRGRSAPQAEGMYAEVPHRSPRDGLPDNTYSLHEPSSSSSEQQAADAEMLKSNPLYHTSEGAGEGRSAPHGEGMYAEVPHRSPRGELPDNTYEQIPGEAKAAPSNTYESLDDLKTKKSKFTWKKNNVKWKNFLPDYKKK